MYGVMWVESVFLGQCMYVQVEQVVVEKWKQCYEMIGVELFWCEEVLEYCFYCQVDFGQFYLYCKQVIGFVVGGVLLQCQVQQFSLYGSGDVDEGLDGEKYWGLVVWLR